MKMESSSRINFNPVKYDDDDQRYLGERYELRVNGELMYASNDINLIMRDDIVIHDRESNDSNVMVFDKELEKIVYPKYDKDEDISEEIISNNKILTPKYIILINKIKSFLKYITRRNKKSED